MDNGGGRYQLFTSSGLAHGCSQLSDFITWTWTATGVIRFGVSTTKIWTSSAIKRVFERLSVTILYNFPRLLHRSALKLLLRPLEADRRQHQEWTLTADGHHIVHTDTQHERPTVPFATSNHCEMVAKRNVPGQDYTFHAHPLLS